LASLLDVRYQDLQFERKEHYLETILIIATALDATQCLRSILEGHGYTVLMSRTSRAACNFAISHGGEIELLIVDKALQGSSVADAADGFQRIRPATRILEISVGSPSSAQRASASIVLPRPFTREAALYGVRKALGSARPTEATA